MKKKFILLLTILSFCTFSQNFQWVKELGYGNSQTASEEITVDANGNIYTTGSFQGTADFDPGPGTFNLTLNATGVNLDIFISKLDPMGNFVWAKNIGGTNSSSVNTNIARSISTDNLGNVYVTGEFRATVDFDPNSGVQLYTAVGVSDIFILKLDVSGNFVWVKTFGNTGIDYGTSISTDAAGNIYTTGNFQGSIDFDPGVGISNVNSIYDDLFILKLDPLGNFVWVKNMGGAISQCTPSSIKLDSFGYIYTTGHFYGSVDFDPNIGTYTLSASARNVFISKLDSSGDFVWAKNMGSATANAGGQSIAIDQLGNVYTTGYFEGIADFDPNGGAYTLTAGGSNIFISKLDVNGNFAWAKSIGGGSSEYCSGAEIEIDPFGSLYLTGTYGGFIDFDPGISITQLISYGRSVYVLKLDASGNYISVKDINTFGYSSGSGLALNQIGDVFVTGAFDRLIDFNNGSGIDTLSTIGYENHSYVLKFGQAIVGIEQLQELNNKSINIYPNPNKGNFTIVTKENMNLNLINNLGHIIQTIELNESNGYQENVKVSTSGMYFITGQTAHESVKQKIIISQ